MAARGRITKPIKRSLANEVVAVVMIAIAVLVLHYLEDWSRPLVELRRVLNPGGRLLLAATEDTLAGRLCGRLWRCRALNRDELCKASAQCGLPWTRQLWLSRGHKLLRMGGILVEARKVPQENGEAT